MCPDYPDDFYYLALCFADKFTPRQWRKIQATVRHPKELFLNPTEALKPYTIYKESLAFFQNPPWEEIEAAYRWREQKQNYIVSQIHPNYPPLLLNLCDPPFVLFVQTKNLDILNQPQLAVVGSRRPTEQGLLNTELFSKNLVKTGLTITSGLAYGVDATAHQSALKHSGSTIAVLGSGLDCIYPKTHKPLAKSIIEYGALISEFLPSTGPKPYHFPRRNRLISGLSLGVLIIEASLKSGSLITAQCALDQGRDVFTIPGSIHNPMATGNHALLQNGAKLVTQIQDILEEIPYSAKKIKAQKNENRYTLDSVEEKIISCLGIESLSINVISDRSHYQLDELLPRLLQMELKGCIKSNAHGYSISEQYYEQTK